MKRKRGKIIFIIYNNMSSTPAIDEKRSEINNTNSNNSANELTVVKTIASQLIHLGVIIIIGTCMLYTCRGSQANLFPSCIDFAPYTDIPPKFSDLNMATNVNITKEHGNDTSTKMTFDIEENMDIMSNHSFFTWLRGLKEGPHSNMFGLYFASIMQSILALNFSIINVIYNFFNNFFSETLIILVMPYLMMFVYFGLAMIDGFYFIYLWFSKLPMFCSEKDARNKDINKTVWKHNPGAIWNFFNWWKIFVAFLLLLFGVATFISTPFVIVAVIYTFLFPLFLKTRVDKKKSYGVFSLLIDVLKFKRNIIMYILAYFLITDSFSIMGAPAGVAAIIVCIGCYFFTQIFHSYKPSNGDNVSSGLTDYLQNIKQCEHLESIPINVETLSGGQQFSQTTRSEVLQAPVNIQSPASMQQGAQYQPQTQLQPQLQSQMQSQMQQDTQQPQTTPTIPIETPSIQPIGAGPEPEQKLVPVKKLPTSEHKAQRSAFRSKGRIGR